MKNSSLIVLLFVISFIALAGLGLNVYTLMQLNQVKDQNIEVIQPQDNYQRPSNDTDINQQDQTEPVISDEQDQPEQSEPTLSAQEQLRQAFADKFETEVSNINLTITENTGTHASGGVKQEGAISGGWWLAAKDGQWKIVADGNGTVPCAAIEPYDFPVDMVPECWDEDEMELVQRTE